MALSLDNIVRVSDSIQAVGTLRRVFGIGLLITNDSSFLGTQSDRIAVYSDFQTLAKDFADTTEPYKAGQKWFSQSPFPRNLVIGRWIDTDSAAFLKGGTVTTTAAQFAALTNTGNLKITINDTSYEVTPDFTSVTTYADVATVLQTALTTAGATVTVTFDATSTSFVITTTNSGASATINYAVAPTSGVDLSLTLLLTSSTAAALVAGKDAETLVEAFEAILGLNDSFYFVMLDHVISTSQNVIELSDFIETGRYMLSTVTNDTTALNAGETASLAYQLSVKSPARTWMTYNRSNDYSDMSIAARFSSIDFNSANSDLTAKFKQLPTIAPDNLSLAQVQELEKKRVNYYTNFADRAVYSEGVAFNPDVYIDVRYALDWFVNAIQVDVFDLLYASGRVPQTDEGEASIVAIIDNVCRQAKTNGMIAGGKVSEAMRADIIATTGNSKFDGNLTNGYLIWSQPTAAQSESDRAARKATAKKVWLKSGGAIHFVEISVTLEN
jgi:hypothetical protein